MASRMNGDSIEIYFLYVIMLLQYVFHTIAMLLLAQLRINQYTSVALPIMVFLH